MKQTSSDPKDIVLSFIEALNDGDYASARRYLSDDFSFKGVMGSRDGADAYMKDMEKMKFKYNLKKAASEGDDVSLLFDFTQGGNTLQATGWYHLENGKIHDYTVIFDPRPLLDGQGQSGKVPAGQGRN